MSRIMFVSTMNGVPWGGSEYLWAGAAKLLRSQGHDVAVNVIRWPQPAKEIKELADIGCGVTQRLNDVIPPISTRIINRVRRVAGLQAVSEAAIDTALKDAAPELVVISQGGWLDGQEWMAACVRSNTPFAPIVQALGECQWPDDAVAERMRTLYEKAVRAYFVSEANVDSARRQMAAALDNAEVVRNPFSVSWDASPPWPADDGVTRLACVARLKGGIKGQDLLFSALRSEKWKSRPIEVSLYGDGDFKSSLTRLKELYGLDKVRFCGTTNDVEEIWSRHHALILTSRMEGLPLVVVEAMLCGRPCIVTDIAGSAELIDDNVTGFVAAATNSKQIDEALERAWSHRTEWPAIGKLAAERIRQLVPRDPIATFAEKVLECVPGRGSQADAPSVTVQGSQADAPSVTVRRT